MTQCTLVLWNKRRKLKNQRHDAIKAEEYKEVNEVIGKTMEHAKNTSIKDQCPRIDKTIMTNNNKEAHKLVKVSQLKSCV